MIFCLAGGLRIGRRPHRLGAAASAGADADGALIAAAPCYVKSHSRGEYVFDRGWAEAYERAGGNYYPKLQVAVPFTPATGAGSWCATVDDADTVGRALGRGLIELSRLSGARACGSSPLVGSSRITSFGPCRIAWASFAICFMPSEYAPSLRYRASPRPT